MASESVVDKSVKKFTAKSLNPCSCGRWLQSANVVNIAAMNEVLILVLVEDGFRG